MNLRAAWRRLQRNRWVTATVLTSLVLGIGVSTLVFGLVDALLLRPVAGIAEPNRVVVAYTAREQFPDELGNFSYEAYREFSQKRGLFSSVAGYSFLFVGVTRGETTERVTALSVTPNYFSALGVTAAVGRLLGPEDDRPDGPVVLTHDLWETRFGGSEDIVGQSIIINGRRALVVGVTSPGFHGVDRVTRPQLFLPAASHHPTFWMAGLAASAREYPSWVTVVARIERGLSLEAAQNGVQALAAESFEAERGGVRRIRLLPLKEVAFGRGQRNAMGRYPLLLFLAVGVVFVLACATLSNISFAQALARRQEIAIRVCLGASRAHTISLVLEEVLLLTGIALAIGLGLAALSMPVLSHLRLAIDADMALVPTWRMLGYALCLALLSASIVGVIPAFRASSLKPGEALRSMPRAGAGSSFSARHLLVASQIGVALVILVLAGHFLRSFRDLLSVRTGFRSENVLIASLDVQPLRLETGETSALFQRLKEELEALPGVRGVATTTGAEPLGGLEASFKIKVPGAPLSRVSEVLPFSPEDELTTVRHGVISSDFFKTLGVELIRGRDFRSNDSGNAPGVVIVNEAMASLFFPEQDALGKTLFETLGKQEAFEIVGIVANTKDRTLSADLPYVFLHQAQHSKYPAASHLMLSSMTFLIRTDGDPLARLPVIRDAMRTVSPQIPLFNITTLEQRLDGARVLGRQSAFIFSGFSVLALLLAIVGVYGLTLSVVRARAKELGIRVALGATPREIYRKVLASFLRLLLIGGLAGALFAWPATRFVEGELSDSWKADPAALTVASLGLAFSTLLAATLAARKVLDREPIETLREE